MAGKRPGLPGGVRPREQRVPLLSGPDGPEVLGLLNYQEFQFG